MRWTSRCVTVQARGGQRLSWFNWELLLELVKEKTFYDFQIRLHRQSREPSFSYAGGKY